ncbi:MAG: MFS transporter [Sulfolobales archaeon]|nr:MFS transporter [Sulfolobales archaeon]MDW7969723.1 MFS transporter [Sulfolobales archaeon]
MASFLTPFTASSIAIAIPQISMEFKLSLAEVNWFANSFLISLSSLVLVVGRLGDWLGKGRVFHLGVALFGVTSLIIFLINGYVSLLMCRFIQGISASMIVSSSVPILVDTFPKERRGFAIGVNVMAVYIGSSLGPVVGGYIVNQFGWRAIFVLKALTAFIGLIAAVLFIDLKRGTSPKPNIVRSLLTPTSIALIILGASNIDNLLWVSLIPLGLVILTTTLMLERRSPKLLHSKLLKKRPLMANSSALFNYSATYALTILLSIYLQRIRGLQPSDAGLVLATQPIVQAALSPIAGYLADRYEPSITASIGMFIISAGIGSLLLINTEFSIINLVLILITLGVGFALFASPNTTAIMNMSPKEAYGTATAFLATMRFLGQALSTSIITSIMRIESELMKAIELSLMIYLSLSVVGAILSLLARESKG